MTMAKRKLSTGDNIYFTLDNYGRRKARKFVDGGGMEAANFDTSGGGLIGMDMEGLAPLAINSGSYVKKSGQGQSSNSPALKALSEMTNAFKQYSETVNSSPDFKPQVDYLAINRESQSDPIGMSADMTGQLIEGIANLKQGERVPLSEKIGLTNHHGKYIHANGGQLHSRRVANKFEEGGGADIGGGGGGAEKYLGVAATAGALTGNAFNQAQTADTRVLEEDIKNTGNMQVSASSNDELMDAWNQRQELNHVTWKDVWGKNIGQAVGNTFSASGQGFSAGASFGGIGAAVGGVVGGLSSLIGSLVGRRRAKKKAKKLNKAIDAANERQIVTLENTTSNVDTNNDLTAMRNYAALGGPLSMYSPYAFGVQGPLEYALMQEDLDIKQQKADNAGESSLSGLTFGKGGGIHINPKNKGKLTATSKRTGKSFSELAHSKNPLTRKRAIFALNARKWHHGKKHAFGGDLESNGANWDLGFTSIGNGGTHEMNPYEGVQMGMDSKGIPNLVEQGEVVYNDYVFSNRLNATPNLLQAYNLPKKYKGMTFSDIAAKISGETKERPNDPISQKGYEDQMERLIQAQEYVRQAQQQEQAIQQAALMQQAQQYAAQQQAQQQAYQNALAQQAYNNQQLGAMQGMVNPEEQMGLGQYGCGGGLKFACGGRKFARGGKKGRLYDGLGDFQQWLLKNNKQATPESFTEFMNQNGNVTDWDYDFDEATGLIKPNYITYGNRTASPTGSVMSSVSPIVSAANGWVGYDGTDTYLQGDYAPDESQSASYINPVTLKPGDDSYGVATTATIDQEIKDRDKDSNWYNKNIKGKKDKDNTLPTWMRYAPALGSAVGLGTSIFWKPNMDYANAIQAAADAAGRFERVGWNPVGNYLQYRPFDTQYALNQLNSQFGATNRAAINNANGNRATAMANLLASQHNYGNQVGGLFAQALQYNDAQRKAVEEFNRATNLANSEGFLKADMANQSARQAAMNSKLQGTVYAQNMKNDLDVGRRNSIMQNLSGLFNNLGRIGDENLAVNELRSNQGLLYAPQGSWFNGAGYAGYKGASDEGKAKGGYLTMGNRRRSRRK